MNSNAHIDMLALRLEAFATNPEVKKELQRAFLCSPPSSLTQDLQVKDIEDGQAESEFASKIAKLLSREKNLNLVFGMFENYIMSEKQLCHLPEHVKSMLFDPQCSNKSKIISIVFLNIQAGTDGNVT